MGTISRLTKNAITASLIRLMSKMPLDKITVKDIVDDCDISRNTFYYNYQDIYAVIEELFEMELKAMLGTQSVSQTWHQIFSDICGFLYEYKGAVYSMYNSSRRDFLEKQIGRVIYRCMEQAADAVIEEAGLSVTQEDVGIIVRFYGGALKNLVLEWLEDKMRVPVDDIALRLDRIFDGSMRLALRQASDKFSTD